MYGRNRDCWVQWILACIYICRFIPIEKQSGISRPFTSTVESAWHGGDMEDRMKTGIALYGANGHQIIHLLEQNPRAELVAVAAVHENLLETLQKKHPGLRYYATLEEMLQDSKVELVSLCSPVRANQATEAILCLKAGKHVYAEKPCAMTETELDEIMETTRQTGMQFHEMAGTAFLQPYLAMRGMIREGVIGEVIQVLAQKSYPYFNERPQDERTDGGLICQNAIHAFRFIEHVAGQRISSVYAFETNLGNPYKDGGLMMAASMAMTLENGGVANVTANYLNPKGFGLWGNEHLRIFGTKGFIESTDGGARTRLIVEDRDFGEIDLSGEGRDYFEMYLDCLSGAKPMPLSLEEELHPTRMVIRAKRSARGNKHH